MSELISLDILLEKISIGGSYTNVIIDEDLSQSYFNIFCSIIHGKDIYFYDGDQGVTYTITKEISKDQIPNTFIKSESKIYLQTSGTTGKPKKIEQSVKRLLNGVKITPEVTNICWGFCYSTRHISGLFMILQAIMSDSALVDLRNLSKGEVEDRIRLFKVSHISAPSTFYRMNFPVKEKIDSMISLSNGGEPLNEDVIRNLSVSFPKAKIRNIYASTEFGSLLVAKGDAFKIPDRLLEFVMIKDNVIYVHGSLVSPSAKLEDGWYITNDRIEWIDDVSFRIVGRVTEDVKVLGHLVSLRTVEAAVNDIPQVKIAKVSSKEHKLFGNLLIAEIVFQENAELTKKEVKSILKTKLKDYEVPSKIKFIEQINLTDSGKLGRT